MKSPFLAHAMCVVIIFATATAHAAEALPPLSVTVQQATRYKASMQKVLAGLKVTVREVSLHGSTLQVSYEDCNEQESHSFILGAVLTLTSPLANGCKAICVRDFKAGRKLSEVSVAPEDIRSIYAAELTDKEEQRLQALVTTVVAAAGLNAVPAITMAPVVEPTPIASLANKGTVPGKEKPAATGSQLVSAAPVAPEGKQPATPGSVTLVSGTGSTTGKAAPVVLVENQQPLAEKLLAALACAKLENITVGVDDCGGWVIGFENRTYRSDITALAAGLRIIAQTLPPVQVAVKAKRDDVPVCQVCLHLGDYAAAEGDLLSPEELQTRWGVQPGGPARPVRTLAAGNSSLGKVDIAFRPAIYYEIGNEAKPFISDEYLITRADTTLARGWHAKLEAATQLTSRTSSALDLGLLMKTGWLSDDLLATGSVGKFEDGFYGWYGEMQWGRQGRLGLVANSLSDELRLGSNSRSQAFGYYEYEAGGLGLTARAGYGRFVDSNTNGALLSLQRRFGENVIVAEAIRAEDGGEAINFRLSVPLGPPVASSPSALRLRCDTAFKIDYMSNLGVQGDYLQKGQDLNSFRGELSAPYVGHQTERLLGEEGQEGAAAACWPASPSLEGNSGLIRIPTADVMSDGELLAGISYMDKEHSRVVSAKTDAMPLFFGVGLLPNLELVGKVTVFHDVKAFDWGYNTDRSFNAHYRVWPQKENRPAVAVGAQDVTFATTSSYLGKSQYVVGTWAAERYRIHLGWGRERLSGPFGGLEYALRCDHRLQAMMDYDTEFVNAGLRGFLNKWITVDMSLLGLSDLGGAVVFKTELK